MSVKLFIHPKQMKIAPSLKKQLQEGGYIVIPEDEVGSVRVIDPLPDLAISDNESAWMVKNLLDLVLNHSYSNQKEKLATRMLNRIQKKITEAKPDQ